MLSFVFYFELPTPHFTIKVLICIHCHRQVTSRKDQEQYWYDKRKPYTYVRVKEFAARFKDFHVGRRITNELSRPYPKERSHRAALSFSRYSVSNMELLNACFNREWLLMKRNSFVYIFKGIQVSDTNRWAYNLHQFLTLSIHWWWIWYTTYLFVACIYMLQYICKDIFELFPSCQ